MIKTFEEACEFVLEHKVCTVFGSKKSPYPSLWDNTDLSEDKPAEGGWSPRVKAVWKWKTEIPQTFPDEVFYGKVPGGDAVLMEMEYLRTVHYPKHFKPVEELDQLSQGHLRTHPNGARVYRRFEKTGHCRIWLHQKPIRYGAQKTANQLEHRTFQ